MNKFKVGDRVAVYNNDFLGFQKRLVGIIKSINKETVYVKGDDWCWHVHYKQCRKLKKKEPKVYWVHPYYLHNEHDVKTNYSKENYVKVKIIK